MVMEETFFTCPVCDWPLLTEDPKLLNYNICEQCGTEFGNEHPEQYPEIRAAWEQRGRPFWLKTGNWWNGECCKSLESRLAAAEAELKTVKYVSDTNDDVHLKRIAELEQEMKDERDFHLNLHGAEDELCEALKQVEGGKQQIASLIRRNVELKLERDCLIAQRHMTIARLGGMVEGAPTCEINFLQRVDELRELEQENKRLVDLANMVHRLARELSMAHHDTGCNQAHCSTKLLLDEYEQANNIRRQETL